MLRVGGDVSFCFVFDMRYGLALELGEYLIFVTIFCC